MYSIASRIKDVIEALLVDIQTDGDNSTFDTVSRASQTPYVSMRMRRNGRGREEDLLRIEEGVTIVPMKPVKAMGTNEKDGVGYRFMIAIAQGRLSDEIDEEWAVPIWEQAIRRRFQNKRMGGLTLDYACELRTAVEPGELPNWALLSDGVDASFLVLTEYVRETRRT